MQDRSSGVSFVIRRSSRMSSSARGRPTGRPPRFETTRRASASVSPGDVRTGPPDIDAGKQEQPDHVDEVPVPGRKLEAEVLLRRELTGQRTDQAHDQEDRADDDVEAVEAGRHEEGGAVDVACEV